MRSEDPVGRRAEHGPLPPPEANPGSDLRDRPGGDVERGPRRPVRADPPDRRGADGGAKPLRRPARRGNRQPHFSLLPRRDRRGAPGRLGSRRKRARRGTSSGKGSRCLASPEVFDALVARGEVEPIGAASIDWLGVPLRAGDRTIGVLAVQSYAGNVRYGEEDQALLGFVSSQVALAIERRRPRTRCARARWATVPSSKRSRTSSSSSGGTDATRRSTPRDRRRSPRRERRCSRRRSPVLPPEAATLWMGAIGRCLDGGGMQVIEYALDVPAGRRAFEGRIVAHDADFGPLPRARRDRARRVGSGRCSERERELKRLTDNMLDVIAETDLRGRPGSRRRRTRGRRAGRRQELLGHSAFDFIHPEDVERVRGRCWGRTARGTGHASSTYRFRKKDGALALGRLRRHAREGRGRRAGRCSSSRAGT